jgi:zinc transport system substrate-binding protein
MKTWLVLPALTLVLTAGCQQSSDSTSQASAARPLVVATFYPLFEFARQVAGDRAEVVALVPSGVEPHDWEPAPADVARLQKARVFVYNGGGFEPWVDKLLAEVLPRDAVTVMATEGLSLVAADLPRHEHTHGHGHGPPAAKKAPSPATAGGAPPPGEPPGARGETLDPHVWLDPVLAVAQVERIRDGLARADAAGAAVFADNARRYAGSLQALHGRFEQGLAACARRQIVVSHAAYGYLARRYRLTQVPVMGLAPEAEPSPAEMARIVRFMRRERVQYVFFETLVSNKLAETLAREVKAKTLVLNPVEGLTAEESAAGKDYLTVMDANLGNLRTGLGCR